MILGQARGRKYHLTTRKAVNFYSLSTWSITFATILSLGFLTLTSSSVPTQASATSFETDVTVPTVLSLTIEPYDGSAFTPSDRMIVTADTAGTYTKTARITAQTNGQYGYKLFVADSDDITALAPVRSSSKVGGVTVYDYNIKGDTVEPIKNPNTALSNFANNTWGYAVETTPTSSTIPSTPSSYNPITINPTQLYATDSPSEGYHFFTFASKIDDTLDANTSRLLSPPTKAPTSQAVSTSSTVNTCRTRTFRLSAPRLPPRMSVLPSLTLRASMPEILITSPQ